MHLLCGLEGISAREDDSVFKDFINSIMVERKRDTLWTRTKKIFSRKHKQDSYIDMLWKQIEVKDRLVFNKSDTQIMDFLLGICEYGALPPQFIRKVKSVKFESEGYTPHQFYQADFCYQLCVDNGILGSVEVSWKNFDDANIRAMHPLILLAIPHLYSIDLSHNQNISSHGWQYLSDRMMSQLDRLVDVDGIMLHELYLNGCNLQDEHLVILSTSIANLEYVDLRDNPSITAYGWKHLTNCIMMKVETLDETKNIRLCTLRIDLERLHTYIEILLPVLPHLEIVDLNKCTSITLSSWQILADYITKEVNRLGDNGDMRLYALHIKSCNLTDEHMQILSPIIPYLEIVDLSLNSSITDIGYENIAKSIRDCQNRIRLLRIHVSYNGWKVLRERLVDYPRARVIFSS